MINDTHFLDTPTRDLIGKIFKGQLGADYVLRKSLGELERIAKVELNQRVKSSTSGYEPEDSELLNLEEANKRYKKLFDQLKLMDEEGILNVSSLFLIRKDYDELMSRVMISKREDLVKIRKHGYGEPSCNREKVCEDVEYPSNYKTPLNTQSRWARR